MKASRFSFYLFMLLLSGMTILSCSKDDPVEPDGGTEEPGIEEPEEPAGDEEMVLGEQTILITPELISHVSTPVTGMQIVLDNSIDEAELPKEGEILLNIERSETFPYGFLGKVSQVSKIADGYVIDTEKAYLDEAFDKLYVEGEMEVTSFDIPMESDSRVEIGNGSTSINLELDDYVEAECKGKRLSFTLSSGKESSISFSTGIAFNFVCKIDIDKEKHSPILEMTLKSAWNGSTAFDFSTEDPKPKIQPLINFSLVPKATLPGALIQVLLRPHIRISAIAQPQGRMNFNLSNSSTLVSSFSFNYKDGIPTIEPKIETADFMRLSSARFELDGGLFVGLQCDFIAYAFSEKIASISIPFSIGPRVSAKFSYDMVQSTPYDALADSKISFEYLHYSLTARCSLFKLLKQGEGFSEDYIQFQSLEGYLGLDGKKDIGILPKFNDMTAERIKSDKTQAVVASTITNDLILPIEVDYQLYDENEDKVSVEKDWKVYQKEEEMNNPFMKTISDLDTDKKYIVRPIINMPIFGEIEASPSVEIEPEISVTTEHYLSQGESLTLLGSFDPALQADCNITEYGICYDTSGNPTLYGTHNAASGNDEGLFQTTIIAEDDVTYYYRAYLIADGQIYYGEVKEAKKEKNDSIIGYWKLKSTHSETIGADHPHDDPGWTWGDLLIKADGTFLTGDPTLYGNWGYSSGSLLLEYEDEGEMLNFYFRINQLDEQILDVVMTVYNDSEVYKMYVTFERLY